MTGGLRRKEDPTANASARDLKAPRTPHRDGPALAIAYGWNSLDLGHGFHDTKQGRRFTLSGSARREVLDRLLELNHQRHAEEIAAGFHDAKPKSRGKGGGGGGAMGPKQGRKPKVATGDLFGGGES